jgi:SnoaL-like domain
VTQGTRTESDRAAISELIAAYASVLDRRQYDQLEVLFAPDGRMTVFENPHDARGLVRTYASAAEFAAYISSAFASYLVTTHFIGQESVAVGTDSASGEVYCLGHHIYERDGTWFNRVVGLRYEDSYARRPDGWRFSHRKALFDWVEHRPMATEPTPERWIAADSQVRR